MFTGDCSRGIWDDNNVRKVSSFVFDASRRKSLMRDNLLGLASIWSYLETELELKVSLTHHQYSQLNIQVPLRFSLGTSRIAWSLKKPDHYCPCDHFVTGYFFSKLQEQLLVFRWWWVQRGGLGNVENRPSRLQISLFASFSAWAAFK
jgi:hypothetical protein